MTLKLREEEEDENRLRFKSIQTLFGAARICTHVGGVGVFKIQTIEAKGLVPTSSYRLQPTRLQPTRLQPTEVLCQVRKRAPWRCWPWLPASSPSVNPRRLRTRIPT